MTCHILVMFGRFHYMALSDTRQRYMPLPDDRLPGRGEALVPPEAVLLVNPIEPEFKGEVPSGNSFTFAAIIASSGLI